MVQRLTDKEETKKKYTLTFQFISMLLLENVFKSSNVFVTFYYDYLCANDTFYYWQYIEQYIDTTPVT